MTSSESVPTRGSSPTVSVVICAHTLDRWDDIVEAVTSCRRQSSPPVEVLLVIDHNDALSAFARAEMTDAIVIDNTDGQGLSGARNSGARAAFGDIVAFLDDDAVADRRWLERLVDAFADPDMLGGGGMVIPRWLADRPSWLPGEFLWVVGCSYTGSPTERVTVRNPIGANMAVRRSVFTDLGEFATGFGQVEGGMLRCDETEFCLRVTARSNGGRFVFVPDAIVEHKVPADRLTWAYFVRRCFTEGLAKAQIVELAGASKGLSAERGHALRTIPMGVVRAVPLSLRQRSVAPLTQAFAAVAGLVITAFGFARGRLALRRHGHLGGLASV